MVHLPQLAHLQSTPQSHILTDGKSAYAPDHGSPPSCVSPAAHTSVTHPDGQQSRELSSVRHSDKQQASIQKTSAFPTITVHDCSVMVGAATQEAGEADDNHWAFIELVSSPWVRYVQT